MNSDRQHVGVNLLVYHILGQIVANQDAKIKHNNTLKIAARLLIRSVYCKPSKFMLRR